MPDHHFCPFRVHALTASLKVVRGSAARLWQKLGSPEGIKLVKYTMVSAISALTSIVVLTVVYGVFRLWSEVWSTLFANIVAGVPSYILNRRWVWGRGGRSHWWRELLPFWVMSLTGVGFALYTATLAKNYANSHDLPHLTRTALVVGANIAAFGIVWLLKYLVLNRLFAQIADAELREEEPEPVS